MKTSVNFALSISVAAALLAGCGASQLPAGSSPSGAGPFALTHQITFQYTGEKQTFKVPHGVTRIRVIAVGGSGGGNIIAYGGRVSAVIPVTPSETLAIYVGSAGSWSGGGFNGGAAGGVIPVSSGDGSHGYGGGGASDVREGGNALTDRVLVAGGGGGQGNGPSYGNRNSKGGQGGALTGAAGRGGCCRHFQNGGDGGTGGTQSQGGSGGAGPQNAGESGRLGIGGSGGSGCGGTGTETCSWNGGNGGGGGGGFYGGGGGGGGMFFGCCGAGGGGGGGGGSSYVESTASNVHLQRGWKDASGNGLVVFSWR